MKQFIILAVFNLLVFLLTSRAFMEARLRFTYAAWDPDEDRASRAERARGTARRLQWLWRIPLLIFVNVALVSNFRRLEHLKELGGTPASSWTQGVHDGPGKPPRP